MEYKQPQPIPRVTSVETPLHSPTWSFSSPSQFSEDSGVGSTSSDHDVDKHKRCLKFQGGGLSELGQNCPMVRDEPTYLSFEPTCFEFPRSTKNDFMTSGISEPSCKVPEGNPLARDLTDLALRFRHTERNSFNPFQGNMRTKNFSQTKIEPSQRLNDAENLQFLNLPECRNIWKVTESCSSRKSSNPIVDPHPWFPDFANPDNRPTEDRHRFVQYEQKQQTENQTLYNFKTELCVLWLRGKCHHGSVCHFAHGAKELRSKNDQLRQ
ncbi:uncharacterized protein LOC143470087 isoform X2 [Clavelina lepadiformis]|uniref:uncharacterized protein LOC143470087 isoform X2 n=1 Tax=Clavelina lepadiformis TaxID=159417 RepID=UPI0040426FCC